jgi:hypothetical protein
MKAPRAFEEHTERKKTFRRHSQIQSPPKPCCYHHQLHRLIAIIISIVSLSTCNLDSLAIGGIVRLIIIHIFEIYNEVLMIIDLIMCE